MATGCVYIDGLRSLARANASTLHELRRHFAAHTEREAKLQWEEKSQKAAADFQAALHEAQRRVHAEAEAAIEEGKAAHVAAHAAELDAVKQTASNEMVAYTKMGRAAAAGELSRRGVVIASYALCATAGLS